MKKKPLSVVFKLILIVAIVVILFGTTNCLLALRFVSPSIASKYPSWFDHGAGERLPNPEKVFGRSVDLSEAFRNDSRHLVASIEDVTSEEYTAYVKACRKYGFFIVTEERSRLFRLKDGILGTRLRIYFTGTSLSIRIN